LLLKVCIWTVDQKVLMLELLIFWQKSMKSEDYLKLIK
jgi:hypothetical protein